MTKIAPLTAARLASFFGMAACLLLWWAVPVVEAQLAAEDIAALRARGKREGWTFAVAENWATRRPLRQLCGMVPPPDWRRNARFVELPTDRELPANFDWRSEGGCTPVRDQGDCGSCWAFATLGPLECNILIRDRVNVNLSEQWLVSCNTFVHPYGGKYGCNGGWFAAEHLLDRPDECGRIGAVLEADFPYAAANLPCNCPYPNTYTITGWAYISDQNSVPDVAAIKQAIYVYGPVGATMAVDEVTQAYAGGIYNHCAPTEINHGVVLVGWDDTQGPGGVWILRNSWGSDWGEGGYMRIPYDCSLVGYGAMFVEYGGAGATLRAVPDSLDFGVVSVGLATTLKVRVTNVSASQVSGQASGLAAPFAIEGTANYTLAPGAFKDITVRFAPTAQGEFYDDLALSASQGQALSVPVSGRGVGTAPPADRCDQAPIVGLGTHSGDNAAAGTEGSASCAAGSSADVWWRCMFAGDGTGTFDTAGSAIDTVLSVYDGCGGQELGCSDDVSAGQTHSRVTIDVNRGRTYAVRVAGKNGQTGNIKLTITGQRNYFDVSGQVTKASGGGLADVAMTGLPGEPVTDDNGAYAATVPRGFSGTVRPVKAGWEFDPPERSYQNVTQDVSDADYQAAPASYTIAGRVLSSRGGALSGVWLRGLPGRVSTDEQGRYTVEVGYGFTADVTPELADHVFDPPKRSYQNVSADFTDQDYTGRQRTGELQIVLQPADLGGAGWRVDSGEWQRSGAVVGDLPIGGHRVNFRPVEGWTAPVAETVTIQPDKRLKLTRHYEQITYLLTLEARPARSGSIEATPPGDANGRHVVGTLVRLRAKPAAGFQFARWIGDDADADDDSAPEVTVVRMTSDRTVAAEFKRAAVKPTETPEPDGGLDGPGCGAGCGAGTALATPLILLGLADMKRRQLRRGRGT